MHLPSLLRYQLLINRYFWLNNYFQLQDYKHLFIWLYFQIAFGYHTRILFQARQILESEYSTLLRDGTDRQQLGVAAMDGNTSSSPSWDEAPHMDVYASNNVPLVDKEGTNIRRDKEAPEMSFTEEDSDASSVIVKTVKRKPKRAPKK